MIKYYITHTLYGISNAYLENDKRVEFDTWEEARRKVISLEPTNIKGFFGWKKRIV